MVDPVNADHEEQCCSLRSERSRKHTAWQACDESLHLHNAMLGPSAHRKLGVKYEETLRKSGGVIVN